MQLLASLIFLASWLPQPGPAAAAANQDVLVAQNNAPAPAIIEQPPPPPPPPSAPPANSSTPRTTCPPLSPHPIPLSSLPTLFPSTSNNNLSSPSTTAAADIEAIKRQLTLYALAIDGRAWAALDAVFAAHATADYGPPIGALAGRDAIRAALPPLLTVWKATQHVLGTVAVDVCGGGDEDGDGDGDGDEAVSVAYMTATHFGRDFGDGGGVAEPVGWRDVVVAYGQYQDRWKRDAGDGVWRIVHRNLVYMGPFVSGV